MAVQDQTLNTTMSRDGTEIAYWTSGDGPPLLLIHGSLGDHTRWDALRPHLEPHVTVHAMDRRGRGGSGDQAEYSIEREYEDVAAVVDSIAETSGSLPDVYCSSYGGVCAFGAAARSLTSNINRLILYEAWPPVDPEVHALPPGLADRLDALLAQGKREELLETAYLEMVMLTPEELAYIRSQPSWAARIAAAHTVPREGRWFAATPFDPGQAANIEVPVILLFGSESSQWRPDVDTVAKAFGDAPVVELEGQGHGADLLAPDVVARHLVPLLQGRSEGQQEAAVDR